MFTVGLSSVGARPTRPVCSILRKPGKVSDHYGAQIRLSYYVYQHFPPLCKGGVRVTAPAPSGRVIEFGERVCDNTVMPPSISHWMTHCTA